MGGKSSQSTQQVTIPPEVLARYNAVNARAETAASQPFKEYSGKAEDFVEPLNETQKAGIAQTGAAAGQAQPYYAAATGQLMQAQQGTQPYYDAATGMALGSARAVNPGQLDVQQYMNPYLNTVLGSQAALLNQQNQQAMAGQTGNAIRQGAFGGDRAGIAAANLQQQNQLANSKIFSDILNQGYSQALGTAQQQQGVNLAAEQANRAALGQAGQYLSGLAGQIYGQGANTAQALAGLGTGAQTAGLQGAQALLGAGQVAQQTGQAGKTALYNQFLQGQSYPFQVAQFLANIAEGTGALSGSTTTTTQPGGFFSDERLKENIEEIGQTHDGQPIYKYNYKGGDKRKQIGLLAQDVEQRHPEAVGLAGGYKTVDYDKATEDSSMGGHVHGEHGGEGFAYGGTPMLPGLSGSDYGAMLQAQAQMFGPFGQSGLYGGSPTGAPHGGVAGYVPQSGTHVANLATASSPLPQQKSVAQHVKEIADAAKSAENAWDSGKRLKGAATEAYKNVTDPVYRNTSGGLTSDELDKLGMYSGGVAGYADGGMPGDMPGQDPDKTKLDIPDEKDTHQLAVAGAPPGPGRSGMQDVMDIAKMAAMFAAARGGSIGDRQGLANGGMPYGDTAPAGGLNIPNQAPEAKLQTAGSLNPQQSGLSQVAQAAGAANGIMGLGSKILGLAHGGVAGGRHGYATDGEVEDVPYDKSLLNAFVESPVGRGLAWTGRELSQFGTKTLPNLAYNVGIAAPVNAAAEIAGGKKLPYVDTFSSAPNILDKPFFKSESEKPEGSWDYAPGVKPPAATPRPAAPRPAAPRPGLSPGVSDADLKKAADDYLALSGGTPAQATGVAPAKPSITGRLTSPDAAGAVPLQRAMDAMPTGVAAPAGAPAPADQKSILERIKAGAGKVGLDKKENLIPLLTGIAAMGTAPTRSLGVAAAAGLGAGAQAYMPTQQKMAEIERTKANTRGLEASAGFTQFQNYKALAEMAGVNGAVPVPDPNGKLVIPNGRGGFDRYSLRIGAQSLTGADIPTNVEFKNVGAAGQAGAKNAFIKYQTVQDPEVKAKSGQEIEQILSSGAKTQADIHNLHTFEQSMSNLASTKGVLKAGALSPYIANWGAILESAIQKIPGYEGYKFSDLASAQEAAKNAMAVAAQQTSTQGQHAYSALQSIMTAIPNAGMTGEASIPMLANIHVNQQRNVDLAKYVNEYNDAVQSTSGLNRSFLASDAVQQFNKDHPPGEYEQERNKLSQLMLTPSFSKIINILQNGTPAQKAETIKRLDQFGGKNFHRYLTGE